MFNLGLGEIFIIFIVALFVFGPGKLPEVSRALGKSIREFRSAMNAVVETSDARKKDGIGDTNETEQKS